MQSTIIKGPKTPEQLEKEKVEAAENRMGPFARFFVNLVDKTGLGNWYLNSMGYRKYGNYFVIILAFTK